ncbi:MAG: nucleotidyltransferase family protein [Desulfobacterales bacterium]|nr:nucleotidyltransferase family protein [Desulfobacterales bacterium]
MFPALYRRVTDICPGAVPSDVLADWLSLYKIHARRNLRITTELIQVLNLLESQSIVAVPYKGPLLAAVAYGDIALRQFVDLDILVSRNDIGNIRNLLFPIGYRLRYSFTKKQESVHLERAHEFTFEHQQRTMLDIHFRFAADYLGIGLDPEEAIARRVPVQILGKTVYSLHPEDNLLMLCQHGTFHLWLTLSNVSDVAHLIHSQASWDWPGVLQRAKDSGLRRQLLLGLSLAQELLGAMVPPDVIQEADADSSVVNLRRRVMSNLFVKSEEDMGFVDITSFYIQSRDSFRDRLVHVWVRLFIPSVEDWQWVPLPDSCYWLYYLIRPLRLGLQGLVLPLLRRFQGLFRVKAVHNHH